MNFKNNKINKDNEYIFSNKDIKIKLCNPTIQPFDFYSNQINTDKKNKNIAPVINAIQYFTYTVKVYHRGEYVQGKSTGPWVRDLYIVADADKGIAYLYETICNIIREHKKESKSKFSSIKPKNLLTLNGFDEFYRIDREIVNNKILYALEIREVDHTNGDKTVRFQLTIEELKALGELIYRFIMNAVEEYEHSQTNYMSTTIASRFTNDNHLYERVLERKSGKKSELWLMNEEIDNIFIIGDYLTIEKINKEEIKNHVIYSSAETYIGTIKELKNYSLILSVDNGDGAMENIEIPFSHIAHIDRNVPNDILHYDFKNILKYWLNNLNKTEKEDFIFLSADKLFKKYKEAIGNRVWIFREEHNLKAIVKKDIPDVHIINGEYYIKQVIKYTKEVLLGLHKIDELEFDFNKIEE